jgi:serine/threonine-protein kinase
LTGATPTAGAMWVRPLHQLDAVQVRGITDTQGGPFISPDGAWIGFASQRDPTRMELIKIAMSGGPPVPICRVDGQLRGASWGADGTIVFATSDPNTGLFSVPANGGEPNALTKPDPQQGELDHTLPFFLPGRRVILFTITAMGGLDSSQIAALDLESGDRKIVLRGATHAQYVDVPTGSGQGHLLYAAAGGLRAVRFDPARLEVVGESVPIVETVLTKSSGAAQFTVSENGTLVFIQGTSQATGAGPASPRSLVWVTRQGREEPIKAPPRPYATPRLSPDGQKIALGIRDQRNDIWTLDLTNGALTPVTLDPAADYAPVWTLDGKRLIFSSERAGPPNLYWQASDGTGRAERLTTSSNFQSGLSLVPDGSGVLVKESVQALPANLTLLRLDKPSETPGLGNLHTEPLLQENRTEDNAVVSSDGGWIAYESDESGQYEVYVRPFPNVDSGRTQVSVNGGTKPLWAPSGRELFYIDAGGFLTVVPVQTSPTFSRGNPVQVLSTRYYLSGARTFDVTRDGQKFLMIKEMPGAGQPGAGQIAASSATTMTVVLSWFEELKAKAGAR